MLLPYSEIALTRKEKAFKICSKRTFKTFVGEGWKATRAFELRAKRNPHALRAGKNPF